VGRTVRIGLVTACGCFPPACAAVSGLDQLSENACAPDCEPVAPPDHTGSEAPPARDAAGQSADGGTAESARETEVTIDAPTARGEATSDTGADAHADAEADAYADADADANGDAAPAADSGGCGTVYFTDSFGGSPGGWTLDVSWTVAPTCAAPPPPDRGNPDPTFDHTTGASGGVLGAYVCGNTPAGETSAFRYATSHAVDVASAPSVFLTFYRWLNSDTPKYMASAVDVYDGTQWVGVYTNPASLVTDAVWTKEQYDVSAYRNPAFQVRFGYEVVSTSAYSMSCWNVDDVTLSSAACP
jgi:hypothetical protein